MLSCALLFRWDRYVEQERIARERAANGFVDVFIWVLYPRWCPVDPALSHREEEDYYADDDAGDTDDDYYDDEFYSPVELPKDSKGLAKIPKGGSAVLFDRFLAAYVVAGVQKTGSFAMCARPLTVF